MLVIPFSQLDQPLSPREEAGATSRGYGLSPERQMTPPRQSVPTWHVAFVHPPLRSPSPYPSSRRPAPRRERPSVR